MNAADTVERRSAVLRCLAVYLSFDVKKIFRVYAVSFAVFVLFFVVNCNASVLYTTLFSVFLAHNVRRYLKTSVL